MKTAREKRVKLLNILGIKEAELKEGINYLNRLLEEGRINKKEYISLKPYFLRSKGSE